MPAAGAAWTVPILHDTVGPTKPPACTARILDLHSRNEAGPESELAAASTVVLEDDLYRRLDIDDVRPVVTPLGSLPVG